MRNRTEIIRLAYNWLVLQDLRFAVRLLWKDKISALPTILTLALCIGNSER